MGQTPDLNDPEAATDMAIAEPSTRPIRGAWMGAFIGFFLGPAVIVATLMLSDPERVTYANAGLVLLDSVAVGAICGSAIGAAIELRRRRKPSMARVVAEAAGGLTGGIVGVVALASSPWIGGLFGTLFGAISCGLLLSDASSTEDGTIDEGATLWDRDLDP